LGPVAGLAPIHPGDVASRPARVVEPRAGRYRLRRPTQPRIVSRTALTLLDRQSIRTAQRPPRDTLLPAPAATALCNAGLLAALAD
jgi:hypothetical protein